MVMRRHADSAETCSYKDTVMKYCVCIGASAGRFSQVGRSAGRQVGTSAHAGLDSISLCNPNVRIMYVPTTRRRADEHSFKVVSIVLNEIKLCGNVPTHRQCRNLRPGQCIGHGMSLCADTPTRRHLGKRGVGQYVGYGVCGYADVPTWHTGSAGCAQMPMGT